MVEQRVDLWRKNEYTYEGAYGFSPFMMMYLHDDEEKRPAMIVVPGGGYRFVSPSEARPVARVFYEAGYNVFVVVYTINMLEQPLKLQPLKDLSRAVRMIRYYADEYCVDIDRVAICGFSAGGHLAASLCVHYQDVEDIDLLFQRVSNRPDAAILSYPVITSGEYAHRDSFLALLGKEASEEELDYMSLEYHVTNDTPPCFIWQTVTDVTVPVENSYLFANACKKAGILFAHHVFSEGKHGMSVANEEWLNRKLDYPYSLEQLKCVIRALQKGEIKDCSETATSVLDKLGLGDKKQPDMTKDELAEVQKHMKEVGIWSRLAMQWLENILY